MLRNLGIRSKLLAVLAVPLAVLVALSTFVIHQAFTETVGAQRVEALTSVTGELNELVHTLQHERSLSSVLLYGGANEKVTAELAKARAATDGRLAVVRTALADAPTDESAELAAAVQKASDLHDQLPVNRRAVDAGGYGALDAHLDFYTQAIDLDLGMSVIVAGLTDDNGLARSLRAYNQLGEVVEASWSERDILARAFEARAISAPTFARAAGLATTQQRGLASYTSVASLDQIQRLQTVLRTINDGALTSARQAAAELVVEGTASTPRTWTEVADGRIATLTSVEPALINDITRQSAGAVDSARQQAMLTALAALLATLAALGLALLLASRLVGPIRRLTAAATNTAVQLPTMVDQMQAPGARPDIELEHIPVDSTDEIGQLAEAFNAVNDVTVKVAHDQAALRASIAEMFVNVARRNQVLLSRQLNHIDDMEAHEENPDTLEQLFRIDHLATRMRRNAESLLVLAGIDANRRLRTPMPLTDVVRSAISEIESFDRVDLAPSVDAPLTGRVAMTAAHLLAELIENATHFSNPDTRVVVATGPAKDGVEVTITDYGLGMSQEDIDEANEKIANPPVGDIAIAQRLGFFVVGRLAQRLEATVRLRRGRSTGTVVTVMLPVELFVPGALPHVQPADAAPETAPAEAPAPRSVTETATPVNHTTYGGSSRPHASVSLLPPASRSADLGEPLPMPVHVVAEPVVEPVVPEPVAVEAPAVEVPEVPAVEALAVEVPAVEPAAEPVVPESVDAESAVAEPVATDLVNAEPVAVDSVAMEPVVTDMPASDAPAGPQPSAVALAPDAAPAGRGLLPRRRRRRARGVDSEPTPVLEPVAELAAEPEPAPEPVAALEPEPTLEPEAALEPVAEVAPEAVADPEPVARVEPELTAEPELTVVPEPVVAPEPAVEPEPVVEAAPVPDQRSVTATLRELATSTPAPTPSEAAEPVADESASAAATGSPDAGQGSDASSTTSTVSPAVEAPAAVVGTPSLDVLPGRHRSSSSGRRSGLFGWLRRDKGSKVSAIPAPTPSRPRRTTSVQPHFGAAAEPALGSAPAAPAGASTPAPSGAGTSGFAPSPFGTPSPSTDSPTPAEKSASGAAAMFGRPIPPSPFARGSRHRDQADAPPTRPSEPLPLTRRVPSSANADVAGGARGGDEFMATRSALASQALSELSRLNSSSYTPAAVSADRPAPLTRRVPRSSPGAEVPKTPEPAASSRRTRNAEEVRNRLSGFRAGIERGRGETVPAGAASATTTTQQTRRSTTKEEKR